MAVYECNGCQFGTCILINMDPEFMPGSACPDTRPETSRNIAVWRELVVKD